MPRSPAPPAAEPSAVGVVVPARDERARIGRSLAAVSTAVAAVGATCAVVVVDDDSADGTADAARDALEAAGVRHRVITVHEHQASRARARGVEALRDLLDAAPADTWLLSTDADSVVPPDWIRRHLDHAARGALAVAGVVTLTDDLDGRRAAASWAIDYAPTVSASAGHPHVHAANLGIRLDVYDAIGGFHDLDRAEDIDLWRRVRAAGVAPVADATLAVSTSARLDGRVELGFASALRRLTGA